MANKFYLAMILEDGEDIVIGRKLDIPHAVKKLRSYMAQSTWPEEMVGYILPDGAYKLRDDGVPYGWVGCVYTAREDSKKKPVFAYCVRKKGQSLDKVSEDYIVKADGTLIKGKW